MSVNKLDTDMAVPTNLDAVSEYYRQNLKTIIRRDSLTSSSETISSIESDSNNKISNAPQNELKLNEISSQDRTHCLLSSSDTSPMSYMHDDILYNQQPSNINSVAVSNSSDVQFGHRINYNGPVVIKQRVVIRDEDGARKTSFVNNGFVDSQNDTKSTTDQQNEKNADNENVENSVKSFLTTHWKKFFIAFVILFLVLLAIFLILYYFEKEPPDIQIIPRSAWNASEPKKEAKFTALPDYYIIAHTVTKECFSKNECTRIIKGMQVQHMSGDFDDIAYNFIVGGDGNVYEGRGWDVIGAQSSSYNRLSIGVGFIGDFRTKPPNDAQLQAGLALFHKGQNLKRVKDDYKILAHCQVRTTESPGGEFFKIIKTWDRWLEQI